MITAIALAGLMLRAVPQTGPVNPPPTQISNQQASLNETLWNAARVGDLAGVERALADGADIHSGNRYKVTALFFAADQGRVEVIRLLLDRGADLNAEDTFYKMRPVLLA